MPRRPRIVLPGVPMHLIQRGNNRQACFFAEEDYRFYLDCLRTYAAETGCAIHAYVLMTNHVHILLSPATVDAVAVLMKRLGQRYVQYVNRTYQRSGTLWEGRFRSCLTQDERYVLSCYRYIELNPVRACMVEHPADYRWSSFRANAQAPSLGALSPHPCYLALGGKLPARQSAYRELFRHCLEPGLLDEIRKATNGNYALGSGRFQEQLASTLGRRVIPGQAGRPKKAQPASFGDIRQ